MKLKQEVKEACINQLEEKYESLIRELEAIRESATGETKSSMGDKYETSREMLTQESNKLTTQLELVRKQLHIVANIDIGTTQSTVAFSSLVKTNKGYFFLSVALGMIQVVDEKVFALSPAAPLSKAMMGLKAGESFQINGQSQTILAIN